MTLRLLLVALVLTSNTVAQTCSGSPDQVPRFQHVLIVVEENQSYEDIIGNPLMPFLNELASHGAVARQYYANTHPSINNYFVLTAGSKGTSLPALLADTFTGTVPGENVASILTRRGRTWRSYAEDLPSEGYTGGNRGLYVKRHNPFAFFSSVQEDKSGTGVPQRKNLVPFSTFTEDWKSGSLPDYTFIVPNLISDAHNNPRTHKGAACGDPEALPYADRWLKDNLQPFVKSKFFENSLLIIVFDEGCERGPKADDRAGPNRKKGGGGRIAGIFYGSHIPENGCVTDKAFHHGAVLRLSLAALGIDEFPGGAASAPSLGEIFSSK